MKLNIIHLELLVLTIYLYFSMVIIMLTRIVQIWMILILIWSAGSISCNACYKHSSEAGDTGGFELPPEGTPIFP